MIVNVCDAIMGTGKTSAAIRFMNEHPERKYIFITPYLDETQRICRECPALRFELPSKEEDEETHNWTKFTCTRRLISEGRNVSTTHASFRMYTPDILENIRKHGYILIIDEAVQILHQYKIEARAIEILCEAGYLTIDENDQVHAVKDCDCMMFNDLYQTIARNNLLRLGLERHDEEAKEVTYYWEIPSEFITSFSEVYVLTYMFEGSQMRSYFKMKHIDYRYIGVGKDDRGFHFSDTLEYIPEYCSRLSKMINICDHTKINNIGSRNNALSSSWFEKSHKEYKEQLQNNLSNYFRNITKAKSAAIMWTTFKEDKDKLKGKGYTKGFVSCTTKATNAYRDRYVLGYCCNMFLNPFVKHCLGGDENCSEDAYAVSSMVQWIWRSAIRDGKEIYIYIPSSRMRTLLKEWIERVENGEPGWSEEV